MFALIMLLMGLGMVSLAEQLAAGIQEYRKKA